MIGMSFKRARRTIIRAVTGKNPKIRIARAMKKRTLMVSAIRYMT